MSLIDRIRLLRRVICDWFTVRIVGLYCLGVTESVPFFTRVELMVLNVSRYVTRSVPFGVRRARFVFRLVEGVEVVRGVHLVINLAVVISCSMPFCQLVHALLMRRRAVGVRGISSASCGLGMDF